MSPFKDVCETELKSGDYIIYAALDGRSAVLRFGVVLEITQSKDTSFYTGRRTPKVKVQGVEVDSWERGGFRLQSKPVFLSHQNRIVRVTSRDLPMGALRKLSKAVRS